MICSVIVLFVLFVVGNCHTHLADNVEYRPDQCLPGNKHFTEPKPEPEDENYVACHQWKDGACCTPEFTQQLATANVTNIDGFHWSRCDGLSHQCRKFFIEIECFYRCSPNVAHFGLFEYDSALANLPLCSDYCDRWYEACKNEMTCAVNWITDWEYEDDGTNQCNENATCESYSDVYGSGRGICETLWGSSFIYSNQTSSYPDDERECLVPYFDEKGTNPNTVVISNMFGLDDDGGATRLNVGFGLMVTVVIAITLSFLMY